MSLFGNVFRDIVKIIMYMFVYLLKMHISMKNDQ